MIMLSRETALSDTPNLPPPDVYVIESDLADPMGGLRLMSELRSRTLTRHAAICIVKTGDAPGDAAMAFDLGANEVVLTGVDPREFGLRIARLMQRKRAADQLRASVRDGLRLAVIDPLTGLYNRRYALNRLSEIAELALTTERPFAVMVLDLDRFKEVNDTHGHPAGDAVLTEVARRMTINIRQNDLLARIGGEEFLIALPETDLAQANMIAQRLCEAVQEAPFDVPGAAPLRLTTSIGLAIWSGARMLGHASVSEVIDRADQALLGAKSAGRNRVTIGRSAA
jgi:two-component system cell cycle response regulator